VPKVIAHATDHDEATWAATQAKLSRTPGRRWSSIAILTRTNAQLTKVQEAMDAARVPSRIAGSDLGPASDLRAEPNAKRDLDAEAEAEADVALGPDSGPGAALDDPATLDSVVLTTFHRAKGLQWPTVMILGLNGGLMPIASAQTEAAVDEERRLLYVALTRSEDELWCSWFDRVGDDASGRGRGPSPWLSPIERTVAELEKEAAPTAASEVSNRVAELRRRLAEGSEGVDTTR
jgi:superfamily I DNA/RNA helicase